MRGYGVLYHIAEAFRGLRANSLVNVLAAGTISMVMLIVGFFLLVFINLQSAVDAVGDRLAMSIYLKDGVALLDKDALLRRLRSEPGVNSVVFISREDALALLRKELRGQEALIDSLGVNPLPDAFDIRIDHRYAGSERLELMAKRFSGFPGVEEVSYGKQGAALLTGIYQSLLYGGMALAVLLGISVIFIISNSVRLALYSRGQEIEIMQWIGATKGFIQGPFVLEGMMLAMIGASLAIGVLAAIFYAMPSTVLHFLSHSSGLEFLPVSVTASMILGAGFLGLTGSLVSVNKFMRSW